MSSYWSSAYLNGSYALLGLRRYQEALTCAQLALALEEPSPALAYVNESYALLGLRRYQAALEVAGQALACDPESALAYGHTSDALREGVVLEFSSKNREAYWAYRQTHPEARAHVNGHHEITMS